jgi:hypothetical protein
VLGELGLLGLGLNMCREFIVLINSDVFNNLLIK